MEPFLPDPIQAPEPATETVVQIAPTESVVVAPRVLEESSVVRSIYLYAMCAVSVALLALGLVTAASSAVRLAAPDAGHRDVLDRVGVGVSNIADSVVKLIDGGRQTLEDFCADYNSDYDGNAVTPDCQDYYESQSSSSLSTQVADVTKAIRSEINSQIRWSAFGRLLMGLFGALAGFVLLRIHRPKVAAYRS